MTEIDLSKIRIRVHHGYNVTSSITILKGEYQADDARLFGLAEYLVVNRHAEVIGGEWPSNAPTEEASTNPLEVFSNAELRDLAAKRGLKATASMNKAQLIALLDSKPAEPDDAANKEAGGDGTA